MILVEGDCAGRYNLRRIGSWRGIGGLGAGFHQGEVMKASPTNVASAIVPRAIFLKEDDLDTVTTVVFTGVLSPRAQLRPIVLKLMMLNAMFFLDFGRVAVRFVLRCEMQERHGAQNHHSETSCGCFV
jgi:hypothetical protein